MGSDERVVRPVALAVLGQRYRCYRLADPLAEEAMAASLRRWGQLVARGGLSPWSGVGTARRLQALGRGAAVGPDDVERARAGDDEQTAKAAILGLNRGQRGVRELEEAWIVQALVRDDGLTQVQAAHLLGQHKSWVCRWLAIMERLSAEVKEELRLGLLGPALARQLVRLPPGNQEAVLALTRRQTLTPRR